jgi:hypothetical protein
LSPEKIGWSNPTCKDRILPVLEKSCKRPDTDKRRPVIFDSYTSLLTAFWEFYRKHGSLAWLVTDYRIFHGKLTFYEVIETNPEWMFAACIDKDPASPASREIHYPAGFIDLSTLLQAKGFTPSYDREEFVFNVTSRYREEDFHVEPEDPMRQAFVALAIYRYLVKTKK